MVVCSRWVYECGRGDCFSFLVDHDFDPVKDSKPTAPSNSRIRGCSPTTSSSSFSLSSEAPSVRPAPSVRLSSEAPSVRLQHNLPSAKQAFSQAFSPACSTSTSNRRGFGRDYLHRVPSSPRVWITSKRWTRAVFFLEDPANSFNSQLPQGWPQTWRAAPYPGFNLCKQWRLAAPTW